MDSVYNEGVHEVDSRQEFADDAWVSREIQLASFVHLAWHDAVVPIVDTPGSSHAMFSDSA